MAGVVLGPVVEEEGNVLTALVRMISADTVVEFGHQTGASARAILNGLKATGKLYSYDTSSIRLIPDQRFVFVHKDMAHNTPTDYDNRKVDFVFFDGAHNLQVNMNALQALLPSLTEDAIIAIHDTGYWDISVFDNKDFGYEKDGKRYHQPDEIKFVETLQKDGWNVITLRTGKELRHGLTIAQRNIQMVL